MDLDGDHLNIQQNMNKPNQIFINPPSLTDWDEETTAENNILSEEKKIWQEIIKNFLWKHIKGF